MKIKLKKAKIQLRHRIKIFKHFYLKRYFIINGIILIIAIHNYVMHGDLTGFICFGSTLAIFLLLFLSVDIQARSDNNFNHPIDKLLQREIGNDQEYKSILEEEKFTKNKKEREKKLKKILNDN